MTYGQPPPHQPGYPPYGVPAAPKHPSAMTAMVLGIVGLAGILTCAGVTLVLSPFAWAMGARAVREIDAAPPGSYSGRDQASAGRVMGMIGTILLLLAVLAIAAVIGIAVAVSETTSY